MRDGWGEPQTSTKGAGLSLGSTEQAALPQTHPLAEEVSHRKHIPQRTNAAHASRRPSTFTSHVLYIPLSFNKLVFNTVSVKPDFKSPNKQA